MATQTQVDASPQTAVATIRSPIPLLALISGWLVPGAGHLLIGKPIRAALLFLAIVGMFVVGIQLQGKIYAPNTGDLLDILGFVGQLGSGVLFGLAHLFDWGQPAVTTALGDYGTKFIVVSGLLNIVSAIDAHSLGNGRKAS